VRRRHLKEKAPVRSELVEQLVVAADQFIVNRGDEKTIIAGYHWFTDWGRDTMIALPGLTLATQRPAIARSILKEFASYVDRGMLPNRFPDDGAEPEYNTVDATLWYFEAVRAYLAHSGDNNFLLDTLYPVLVDILAWHQQGTRHEIKVADDGLLAAGTPSDQLTWMDAKIGERVATPRHGKAVEIQALWYNALKSMEAFAVLANDAATQQSCNKLAAKARKSFRSQFWNSSTKCLFDVINEAGSDPSIRPNQILAVSLPHSMLTSAQMRSVIAVVEAHLRTPYGLRTLSPADPAYRSTYEGGPDSRDLAYHQGPVWPWLFGPFLSAYLRVNKHSEEAKEQAEQWIKSFSSLLGSYGLGQIGELADSESPFTPKGCIAQAWSVGELLRVLVEDFYGHTAPTLSSSPTGHAEPAQIESASD
jgi:predicted glycogen debranching enzyme